MFGVVGKDVVTTNAATKGIVTCHKLVADVATIGNFQSNGQLVVSPNSTIVTVEGYLPTNYVAAGDVTQMLNKVRNAPAATAITDAQVLRLPENALILEFFIYQDNAPIIPASLLNVGLSEFPPSDLVDTEALCFNGDTTRLENGIRGWALTPPYPTTFNTSGSFWSAELANLTTNDTTGVSYRFETPVVGGNLVVRLSYVVNLLT